MDYYNYYKYKKLRGYYDYDYYRRYPYSYYYDPYYRYDRIYDSQISNLNQRLINSGYMSNVYQNAYVNQIR